MDINEITVWTYNIYSSNLIPGDIIKIETEDNDIFYIIGKHNYPNCALIRVSRDQITETKEIAIDLLKDHLKRKIEFLKLDLDKEKRKLKELS